MEGERVWRVPPLSLPADGESLDGDAVLLFLDRTVLQRLAVFRGPFGADAARAVAAGWGVDERDVLTLLAHLVEKLFVVIDERDHGSSYRLLDGAGQLHRGHR